MGFRKPMAYPIALELAMKIFEISKTLPKEEPHSLTDQIRRSLWSICANIAEFHRKSCYPKHYISKLFDSDTENAETECWLEFALACKYISHERKNELENKTVEIGKLINFMMNNPENFS